VGASAVSAGGKHIKGEATKGDGERVIEEETGILQTGLWLI
jgi:hypothetical protein